VFEEHHRIVATDGSPQQSQPHRAQFDGKNHAHSRSMSEYALTALRVINRAPPSNTRRSVPAPRMAQKKAPFERQRITGEFVCAAASSPARCSQKTGFSTTGLSPRTAIPTARPRNAGFGDGRVEYAVRTKVRIANQLSA